MSLYKYVIAERIDVLKNEHIRFSQSSALNDPIEVSPVFKDVANPEIRNLITDEKYSGLQIVMTPRMLNQSGDGHWEDRYVVHLGKGDEELRRYEAYMAEIVRRVSLAFGAGIGVLSLTEKSDNLLMWAHYAQQHQGFVLEFDEGHSFFQQEHEHPEFGRPLKLTYSIERPRQISMTQLTNQEFFLTKSKEWEYEQEWRMLRLLSDSNIKMPTRSGMVHLFPIPSDCIIGLILGCRMLEKDRNEIRKLLIDDERYHHVRVYQAEINSEAYQLKINPITRAA